ncbi:uncharacterized protein LOC110902226 [Helianthus annuus]|uniref:uncharacterized protein LOC110902226 n=1 Tax=Helianthus annuus TaxID=4232 RepID=UPI000B8F6688|nr:uncharacterized protein LOC110902226 [Helianthus annuus]
MKWVKVSARVTVVNNIKTLTWDWRSNPNSAAEVTELFQLLNEIHDFNWKGGIDSWNWKHASDGLFSVKSAKSLLSDNNLAVQIPKIKWKVWVPLKCKIMVWRVVLNRLPTIAELVKRGVRPQQTCCAFCQADLETSFHLFTGCMFVQEVWYMVETWCRLNPNILFDVADILKVPETLTLTKKAKHVLRGIVYTTLWVIWNERNNRIFNNKHRRPIEIVETIKFTTFFWICNRSRWEDVDWSSWHLFPLD